MAKKAKRDKKRAQTTTRKKNASEEGGRMEAMAAAPKSRRTARPAAEAATQHLNPDFSTEEGFDNLQRISELRHLPTPRHLDAVVNLARRTPGLEDVWDELEVVKKDYQALFNFFRDDSDFVYLFQLLDQWYDFRAMVMQRWGGLFTRELRTADRIARDIFQRFFASDLLDNAQRTYGKDARPVTFIGPTGPDSYYTWPPQVDRPLGIINVPQGSVNNGWGWLALAHEVGHDIYASIVGLDDEMESVLETAMKAAVSNGEFSLADVAFDDGENQMNLSGADFAGLLWKRWANESQADIVGLLNCGGAAVVTLQPIIGFGANDAMDMYYDVETVSFQLGPEVHPTSYIRNVLNIRALRALGFADFADELQVRFENLRPTADRVTWTLPFSDTIVTEQPIAELEKSVEIAVAIFLDHRFQALDNHSYREIIDFSLHDQRIVDRIVDLLLAGDPFFDRNARPRHALAATSLALEKDASKAELIHETLTEFLGPV